MLYSKIFNINGNKYLIYNNNSYNVTDYFLDKSVNFSLYIECADILVWVDIDERLILLHSYNNELLDIFFPDITCPISVDCFKLPYISSDGISYEFNKQYTSKEDYLNRDLISTINKLKKTKFVINYTKQQNKQALSIFSDSFCPVSLTFLKEPVITPNGNSFESTVVNKLLSGDKLLCPITRNTYRLEDLYSNKNLQAVNKQIEKINVLSCKGGYLTIGISDNVFLKDDIDRIFKIVVECNFWNNKKSMNKLYKTLFLLPDMHVETIPVYISNLVKNSGETPYLILIKQGDLQVIKKYMKKLIVYYSCLELCFKYNRYRYLSFKRYFLKTIKNRLIFERNNLSNIPITNNLTVIEDFFKYPHETDSFFSKNIQKIKHLEHKVLLIENINKIDLSITFYYSYLLNLLL